MGRHGLRGRAAPGLYNVIWVHGLAPRAGMLRSQGAEHFLGGWRLGSTKTPVLQDLHAAFDRSRAEMWRCTRPTRVVKTGRSVAAGGEDMIPTATDQEEAEVEYGATMQEHLDPKER